MRKNGGWDEGGVSGENGRTLGTSEGTASRTGYCREKEEIQEGLRVFPCTTDLPSTETGRSSMRANFATISDLF